MNHELSRVNMAVETCASVCDLLNEQGADIRALQAAWYSEWAAQKDRQDAALVVALEEGWAELPVGGAYHGWNWSILSAVRGEYSGLCDGFIALAHRWANIRKGKDCQFVHMSPLYCGEPA